MGCKCVDVAHYGTKASHVPAALLQAAGARVGRVTLTDLCAPAESERDAEAFQSAVRFQHHVRGRIIRIRVLHNRRQVVTFPKKKKKKSRIIKQINGLFHTIASEPWCSSDVGNLTSLTVKVTILCDMLALHRLLSKNWLIIY